MEMKVYKHYISKNNTADTRFDHVESYNQIKAKYLLNNSETRILKLEFLNKVGLEGTYFLSLYKLSSVKIEKIRNCKYRKDKKLF